MKQTFLLLSFHLPGFVFIVCKAYFFFFWVINSLEKLTHHCQLLNWDCFGFVCFVVHPKRKRRDKKRNLNKKRCIKFEISKKYMNVTHFNFHNPLFPNQAPTFSFLHFSVSFCIWSFSLFRKPSQSDLIYLTKTIWVSHFDSERERERAFLHWKTMGHSATVWDYNKAANEMTKDWNGIDQVVLKSPLGGSAKVSNNNNNYNNKWVELCFYELIN